MMKNVTMLLQAFVERFLALTFCVLLFFLRGVEPLLRKGRDDNNKNSCFFADPSPKKLDENMTLGILLHSSVGKSLLS